MRSLRSFLILTLFLSAVVVSGGFLLAESKHATKEEAQATATKGADFVTRVGKGLATGGQWSSGSGGASSSSPKWDVSATNWSGASAGGGVGEDATEALRSANLSYGTISGVKSTSVGTFREPKKITELHSLQVKGFAKGFQELEAQPWGKLRSGGPATEVISPGETGGIGVTIEERLGGKPIHPHFPSVTVILGDSDDPKVHEALVTIEGTPHIIINTNRDWEKELKAAAALSDDELFGSTSVGFRRAVEVYKKAWDVEAAAHEEARVYAVNAYVGIYAAIGAGDMTKWLKKKILETPREIARAQDYENLRKPYSVKGGTKEQRQEREAYKNAHPDGAQAEWKNLSEKDKAALAGDWLRAHVSGKAAADWAAGDMDSVTTEVGVRYLIEPRDDNFPGKFVYWNLIAIGVRNPFPELRDPLGRPPGAGTIDYPTPRSWPVPWR